MEGRELLRLLMAKAGENPNSLSVTLKTPSLQSQVARFLRGQTNNPRHDTLRPVADHYGISVNALFDEHLAAAVAQQRGLLPETEQSHGVTERPAAWPASAPTPLRPTEARPAVRELLMQLAAVLLPYDPPARKAAAALLEHLAISPEDAALTTDRILALLEHEPKNARPRSTGFR